jgi:3-hydroxybutyryl-CoA dehydratase
VAAPPQTLSGAAHRVSQEQLIHYAEASGDHNPLHLDGAFAVATPFGKPIAHGMLVLAFLSEMLTQSLGSSWVNGGRIRVRFRAPVYPGDVVTTQGMLRQAPSDLDEVTYTVACLNQSGEQVITGDATVSWPSGE